jgi:hypothetical protein
MYLILGVSYESGDNFRWDLHCESGFVGHVGGFPFKGPGDADLVGEVLGCIGGVPEGEVGDDCGGEGWEGRECPVAEGRHLALVQLW